jgi:hypothetical protein
MLSDVHSAVPAPAIAVRQILPGRAVCPARCVRGNPDRDWRAGREPAGECFVESARWVVRSRQIPLCGACGVEPCHGGAPTVAGEFPVAFEQWNAEASDLPLLFHP